MQSISTCLWFDFNAGQAVAFYLGIFRNSRVRRTFYYGDETPEHKGKVLLVQFELAGQVRGPRRRAAIPLQLSRIAGGEV